ncbi:ribonuclease bn, partial [Plakobranchus ocellatus]
LDAQKLMKLGVLPGPMYAKIKSGETITLDSGQVISPGDVMGANIPGRTIVVGGDSCDSTQLHKVAQGADVLVHEATLENSLAEQCVQNGHSTPGRKV